MRNSSQMARKFGQILRVPSVTLEFRPFSSALETGQPLIQRVENERPDIPFREVFLIESVGSYSATLYGDRKHKRRRKAG